MTTSGLLVMAFGLAMMAYGISPWVSYRSKALATREVNKAWFFAVLALAVFGAMNANLMITSLLVEISTDLDISVAVAGQLATATFAAWGTSVVALGPLSDSFGRRPIALAGLLLIAGSLFGSAFAPNIEVFLVLRVLTGLGAGTLPPSLVGAISEVISPERRAWAVGALLAVVMLASVISVPAVAVLADWGGWRFTFIASGLLSALGLVANWLLFLERQQGAGSRHRHFLQVLVPYRPGFLPGGPDGQSRPPHRLLGSGQLLRRLYDQYIRREPAVRGSAAGNNGNRPGDRKLRRRSCGGEQVPRCPHYRHLAIGGACGFMFFAVELQFWVAVAAATLGTGLLSVNFPALVAASTEHSGESQATGVGMMGLSNHLGGVLGAAIAGWLLASTGYEGIAYMCLGAAIVSVLMAGLFAKQLRRGSA